MIPIEAVAGVPIFAGVGPRALRELAARAVERRYAAGETLFTAGSAPRGFFVVLEGEVRVLRGGARRQHVVHVEGPGGTLGEVSLFDGGGYPATAVASAPVRCLVFPRAAIEAALAADPQVAWVFFRRLASRTRHLVDRLDRLAARSVTSRLAALLLARADEAGPGPFTLGRTQSQAAEELGTVREVLVRSLRDLRSAGAIRWTGRGRYEIVGRELLARLAEGAEAAELPNDRPGPARPGRSGTPRSRRGS
ncbi:MAG TPA: Crp/Fnr family transcriptional regulator [Gemmatimonadales bacterium]|nr:Crp/Fnr family transcriptional regulator [Gemmatimonadales bacterium]